MAEQAASLAALAPFVLSRTRRPAAPTHEEDRMQFQPRSRRTPVEQPRKLQDVLDRKARAAQQMRAAMPNTKRLPGHGHRVHGR
jgi:hypothetical protein